MSKVVIENKIIHEKFATIINEEKRHHELKESIGMMKSGKNDLERNRLITEVKRIGIYDIIKQ